MNGLIDTTPAQLLVESDGSEVIAFNEEHGAINALRSEITESLGHERGRQAAVPELGEHAHRAHVADPAAAHRVDPGPGCAHLQAGALVHGEDVALWAI